MKKLKQKESKSWYQTKVFETPDQMQKAIQDYFTNCEVNNEPKTIEGLSCILGISRTTLLNYENTINSCDFHNIVKAAKQEIRKDFINKSLDGTYNPLVAIFLLKNNFGYEDKQHINSKEAVIIKKPTKDQPAKTLASSDRKTIENTIF